MSILRVKEILKEKGITGKELASKLNMTEVGLYKALSDKGNPPLNRLQEIANALDVKISELFESKQEKLKCPHCGKPITITLE